MDPKDVDLKEKGDKEEPKSEQKNDENEEEEFCTITEEIADGFLVTKVPAVADDTLIGKTHTWKDVKNLMMKPSYKNSTHYVSYNY